MPPRKRASSEIGAQLDMFGGPPRAEKQPKLGPAQLPDTVRALAAKLPSRLYLGTSSWSFPGWNGLVWDREASVDLLAKEGLSVYAQHPLFRSVGIDRTYYAPISADAFRAYADAVPETFRFLAKAAESVLMPRFPHHPRYGSKKGEANPRFLDVAFATDAVVAPFVEGLGSKAGPLLFQFSPLQLDKLGGVDVFIDRLHGFLSALPKGPLYAVEFRNRELFVPRVKDALFAAGVVPALTGWSDLPTVAAQAEALGALEAKTLVIRWMLAPGQKYETAKDAWDPFNQLMQPDDRTRELIVRLTQAAIGLEKPAYVIVNNKAEGSSPLSLIEIARAYAESL